jgi:hypothetical protein
LQIFVWIVIKEIKDNIIIKYNKII